MAELDSLKIPAFMRKKQLAKKALRAGRPKTPKQRLAEFRKKEGSLKNAPQRPRATKPRAMKRITAHNMVQRAERNLDEKFLRVERERSMSTAGGEPFKMPRFAAPAKLRKPKLRKPKKPSPERTKKIAKARKIAASPKPHTQVGVVTHYIEKIKVAIIRLEVTLREGETIRLPGEDGLYKQKVSSMQINRKPVEIARPGDEIGLKVKKAVTVGVQVLA